MASSAIRAGSSTRSRRRACGSSTAAGTQPSPTSTNSACDGPFAARSWKSSTRSVNAIAPADQATTVGGWRDGEQPQHVPQHPDVPARDGQRRRPGQPLTDRVPVPATAGRSAGGHRSANVLRSSATRARCRSSTSRTTDSASARASFRTRGPPPPRRADLPQRAQHPVELHEIQLLLLGERRPVRALGRGVLGVPLQHVLPAGVQGRLRLRPSSSASSSASSGSRSCQPAVTVATGPSRPTASSVGRRCGPSRTIMKAGDHEACTWTVRPTSSSIPRSTS